MKKFFVLLFVIFLALNAKAEQPNTKDTYMALQATGYAIEFLAHHAPVYWENPKTGFQGSSTILSGHRDEKRVLMRTCLKEPQDRTADEIECQKYRMVYSVRGWVAENDPAGSIGISASADPDQVYRAACYHVNYRLDIPKQGVDDYKGVVCKTGRTQWKVMP